LIEERMGVEREESERSWEMVNFLVEIGFGTNRTSKSKLREG
jgi:hypothetical protein